MNDVNLLLRILGNPDDAKGALREVSRQLTAFGKRRVQAHVDVATERAQQKVRTLRAELLAIAAGDYTAVVEVKERFDRSIRARFARIGEAARDTRVHLGLFSLSLATMGKLIGLAIPLVVSLGASIVALVGSLGAAAAGIGALGVAGLGVFGPMAALVGGIVARFKEGSAAASELKAAAQELGRTFTQTLAEGADRAMRGISQGLRSIATILPQLQGAFTELGGAAGSAFARIGAAFAEPIWVDFFRRMTQAATRIVPLLTDTFIALSAVLRDTALAALPYLEQGLASIARWTRDLAASTADAARMDEIMAGLMGHLGSWLDLIGATAGALGQLFRGAAPAGQELVDWMAEGLRTWTAWASSAEGQQQIREFFDRMVPITQKLVTLFLQLVETAIYWSEFFAPVAELVLDIFNALFSVVNGVAGAINSLPGPLKTVLAFFFGFGKIKALAIGTRLAIAGIVTVVTNLGEVIGGVIGVFRRFVGLLGRLPGAIREGAVRAFRWLIRAGRDAVQFLRQLPERVFNIASRIVSFLFEGIKTLGGKVLAFFQRAFRDAIEFLISLPERFFRLAANIVGAVIEGLRDAAGEVVDFFRRQFDRAIRFLQSLPGRMFDLGKSIVEGLINGLKSSVVPNVGSPIIDSFKDAAKGLLPALPFSSPISGALDDAGASATRSAIAPSIQPAGGGGAAIPAIGSVVNHFVTPAGGPADPEVAAAQFMRRIRERGLAL